MKKILNIFAIISLITTWSSSVMACGSGTKTNANDQNIVNDIIHRLDKKTFNVDEKTDGIKTFENYKSTLLKDIQSNLTEQEKNLVSFPVGDNKKKLNAENSTDIDVHIQSDNVENDISINVNLKHDATSIANAVNGKIITVFQKKLYQQKEKASDYLSEIQSQILTPSEQKSGYKISNLQTILANTYIYWPYWNNKTGEEFDQNEYNPVNLTIKIGQDTASTSVTLEFKYYQQKELIDDPAEGSKDSPEEVNTNGKSVPPIQSDWYNANIKSKLDSSWAFESFSQYVSYMPLSTIGPNIPSVAGLLCPLLGITQNHFRMFWIKDN